MNYSQKLQKLFLPVGLLYYEYRENAENFEIFAEINLGDEIEPIIDVE
jgi:hypothetical protein